MQSFNQDYVINDKMVYTKFVDYVSIIFTL